MWASSFRIRAIWIQWSECRASPLLLPWSAKTLITAPYFRHSWRNSRDPSGLKAAQLFLGRSSWLGLKSSAFPVWCFLFKEGVLRVPYSPKRSLLYDLEHDPLHPETPWDTLRHRAGRQAWLRRKDLADHVLQHFARLLDLECLGRTLREGIVGDPLQLWTHNLYCVNCVYIYIF